MEKDKGSKGPKATTVKQTRKKAPAPPAPEAEPTEEPTLDTPPAHTEEPTPVQEPTPEPEAPPAEESPPAPEPTPPPEPERDSAQILIKVTPAIKDKAQKQAGLAFQYGWIPQPTVKHLFVWIVDVFLDAAIRQHIEARKKAIAYKVAGANDAKPKQEEEGGHSG